VHHAGQIEATPAHFSLQEVELILANLFDPDLFRGPPEVFGELSHVADVALDRVGGAVAESQIFDEAFSQRCHGKSLINK
jgi:hypothetical protein